MAKKQGLTLEVSVRNGEYDRILAREIDINALLENTEAFEIANSAERAVITSIRRRLPKSSDNSINSN